MRGFPAAPRSRAEKNTHIPFDAATRA